MPTLPAVERRIESKMKDIRQNIGKNIVRLRTAAHLTQAQFAEQLNYTDKAVSYQVSDYPLGEILAKLAYEKAVNNEETDWRKLKPLYIQPPPVFGK